MMPLELARAEGVDQQAPEDRGEAERQVGHDGVKRKEMAAAHDRRQDHGQPRIVHVDQRVGKSHHQFQQKHQANLRMDHPAGQQQPADQNEDPDRQTKGQHRLAAQPVGARLEVAQSSQAA